MNGTKTAQKIKIQIPELNLSYQTKTDDKGFVQVEFSSDFQLWSPANPKLYRVIVESETDTVVDEIGFKGLISEDGEKKKAWYVMKEYYKKTLVPEIK